MIQDNEIYSLMRNYFSACPICNSNSKFVVVNEKKSLISCQECLAVWKIRLTQHKDDIVLLTLKKSDKEKQAKSLLGLKKTLGFWQNCNVTDYSTSIEKTIKKQIVNYGEFSFKKIREKAHKELLEQGDYSLFNALSLVAGCYPQLFKPIPIQTSLNLIEEYSDIRTLPDLQRIYHLHIGGPNCESIINLIVKIALKNEMYSEMVPFYENAATKGRPPIVRSRALLALMICIGKPGAKDPFSGEQIRSNLVILIARLNH